jgi:hypothetical protein
VMIMRLWGLCLSAFLLFIFIGDVLTQWVCSLLQKLVYDLRMTLLPSYTELLTRLIDLLPRSIPAQALTALLATLSALFKHLLISSVYSLDETLDCNQDLKDILSVDGFL